MDIIWKCGQCQNKGAFLYYRYRYFTRGIDASYRHILYRYIDPYQWIVTPLTRHKPWVKPHHHHLHHHHHQVLTSFSGSGNCSSTRLWSCLKTTLITGGHWETELAMASMMLLRYVCRSPTLLSLTSASDAEPLNEIRLQRESASV